MQLSFEYNNSSFVVPLQFRCCRRVVFVVFWYTVQMSVARWLGDRLLLSECLRAPQSALKQATDTLNYKQHRNVGSDISFYILQTKWIGVLRGSSADEYSVGFGVII